MRCAPPDMTPQEIEESRRRRDERSAPYRRYGHDREKAIGFAVNTATRAFKRNTWHGRR